MAIGEAYFDSRRNAGSKYASSILYTGTTNYFLKKDDTLDTFIKKAVDKLKELEKKVTKLEE